MIDGTYGFVYSGLNGLGFGVFTILGEKFEGVDFVGNRYTGTAREQHSCATTSLSSPHRTRNASRIRKWTTG